MTVVEEYVAGRPRGGLSSGLLWAGFGLIALAGAWFLLLAWQEGLSGGRDFVQDFAAIWKIGQGRNPYEPYNDITQALWGGPPHRGALYSFHAPTSLPLLIWLLPIAHGAGYTGAFLAWGLASVGALWAICWLTLRALGAPRPALSGLLAALALNLLPPIRENFEEGQLNVVVAAGMVGCWAAQREGRPGLAGVLLGAAFALKPIPGLFFLYYLWRREWRLLYAAAGTLAALGAVGVALSGVEGAWLWATVNYPSHAAVWPGYPDNASVRGFFTRLFGPSEWRPRPRYNLPSVTLALWALSGAVLTLAALAAARGTSSLLARGGRGLHGLLTPRPLALRDPRGDLEVAVLTVLTLLVTPIVWPHYYVVLVMPIALVAGTLARLAAGGVAPTSVPDPAAAGGSLTTATPDVAPLAASARLPDSGPLTAQAEPGSPDLARGRSGAPVVPDAAPRRWRLAPVVALLALAAATAVLANAYYVEPFRRVGGQQLTALLVVYGASLAALWWSARGQGDGVSPAAAR